MHLLRLLPKPFCSIWNKRLVENSDGPWLTVWGCQRSTSGFILKHTSGVWSRDVLALHFEWATNSMMFGFCEEYAWFSKGTVFVNSNLHRRNLLSLHCFVSKLVFLGADLWGTLGGSSCWQWSHLSRVFLTLFSPKNWGSAWFSCVKFLSWWKGPHPHKSARVLWVFCREFVYSVLFCGLLFYAFNSSQFKKKIMLCLSCILECFWELWFIFFCVCAAYFFSFWKWIYV